MSQTFILIDGSYFIFYRYYALVNWWKHAQKEGEPTIENKEFLEKYEALFIEKIKEMKKKLKLKDAFIIAARDCPRSHIWRTALYPPYKATRVGDENVGSIFKYVYANNLFAKAGCYSTMMSHPGLEADDCIALFTKYIKGKIPSSLIYIIASDADYMQLKSPDISILNLRYKSLVNNKTIFDDPLKNLFCKIVSGDKSDNIPAIISKCGIKTAIKHYENPEKFKELLETNSHVREQYNLNKKLIDFNEIPRKLCDDFMEAFIEKM